MKQYSFLNEQLTFRKMMPKRHQLRSYRRELRKMVDEYKGVENRRGISNDQVKKNILHDVKLAGENLRNKLGYKKHK